MLYIIILSEMMYDSNMLKNKRRKKKQNTTYYSILPSRFYITYWKICYYEKISRHDFFFSKLLIQDRKRLRTVIKTQKMLSRTVLFMDKTPQFSVNSFSTKTSWINKWTRINSKQSLLFILILILFCFIFSSGQPRQSNSTSEVERLRLLLYTSFNWAVI